MKREWYFQIQRKNNNNFRKVPSKKLKNSKDICWQKDLNYIIELIQKLFLPSCIMVTHLHVRSYGLQREQTIFALLKDIQIVLSFTSNLNSETKWRFEKSSIKNVAVSNKVLAWYITSEMPISNKSMWESWVRRTQLFWASWLYP